MNQCDRGNLLVDRMFRVRRHQPSPHLSACLIEIQYPVGLPVHDQIKPFLEPPGLRQVTAALDAFEPAPDFSDRLDRNIEITFIDLPKHFPHTRVGVRALSCLADDIGVNQIHAGV